MARVLRFLNLGAAGDPKKFVVTSLPDPGQIGGVYEGYAMDAFQLFQIVDTTLSDKNIAFVKSYDGTFSATPTVGNSSRNEPAGVNVSGATIAQNSYALLQQRGVASVAAGTVTSGLTAARGSRVIPDSVAANTADFTNIGTAIALAGNQNVESIGIAQAAVSGGNVSTYLHINAY